jgi:hypothetical protein
VGGDERSAGGGELGGGPAECFRQGLGAGFDFGVAEDLGDIAQRRGVERAGVLAPDQPRARGALPIAGSVTPCGTFGDAGERVEWRVLWETLGSVWRAPVSVGLPLICGVESRREWQRPRLRWATTKIGLVSIAVLVITAIYAGMLTWWITPVIQTSGQRFAYIFFDIHGIVVFGYVMFALALGVFAGAVTGRLLPAMATTVVGFIGVRVAVMLAARDRYMATETRRLPLLDTEYPQMRNDLNGDWIVASHAGTNTEILTVHPAHQFWAFQAIETGIFAALAITLLVSSIYWVRRRIT